MTLPTGIMHEQGRPDSTSSTAGSPSCPDVYVRANIIRRSDLPAVTTALEDAGFIRAEVLDVTRFLDGPEAKPSESIHLIFAGEKVRADHPLPAPDLAAVDDPAGFRVITLEALVQMKLVSNRDKDRTHIRDLISIGLVDRTWLGRLPAPLTERLEGILDSPES